MSDGGAPSNHGKNRGWLAIFKKKKSNNSQGSENPPPLKSGFNMKAYLAENIEQIITASMRQAIITSNRGDLDY